MSYSKKFFKTAMNKVLTGATAFFAASIMLEHKYRSEPRDPLVWAPASSEKVLLRNAEIIDVTKGKILHNRSLLIVGGKIENIHTAKEAESLGADWLFDLEGMYLIPGLINTHCHTTLMGALALNPGFLASLARQVERNYEECVVHGVTTVRDMGGLPKLIRRFSERIERGELLGPRIFYAGTFITVPGGYPDYFRPLPSRLEERWGDFVCYVRTPQEARDAVKRNLENGSSLIKIAFDHRSLLMGQKPIGILDDQQLGALVDEARNNGVKVASHHRFRKGFNRALEFGVESLEHVASDEHLTEEEIERFLKGGHSITPTVSVGFALGSPSRDDPFLEDPLVQLAQTFRRETVRSIFPAFCEPAVYQVVSRSERNWRDPMFCERRHLMFTTDPKIFTEGIVKGRENINRLYRAGALIGCGNDGGVPLIFPGALALEMILLEMCTEMRAADVLRAATINNARILGLEDKLGSVERGKLADLVILSGNPLEKMESLLSPLAVFKEGKLLHSTPRFPPPRKR